MVLEPVWGGGTGGGEGAAASVAVRAACQSLAHQHAAYLGFYDKVESKNKYMGLIYSLFYPSSLRKPESYNLILKPET